MGKSLPSTILYIHSSDEMYGADLILLQLIEHLDPSMFRPVVVLPTDMQFDGKLSAALRSRGVKVVQGNLAVLRRWYFHPARFLLYLWRFSFSIIWLLLLIRRERVDLIHSNTLAVLPGVFAAKLTNTPHVWHIHEIILRPRFLWRLTAWLAATLSTVNVAVSNPTREHLIKGAVTNKQKSLVIYNGIDVSRFQASLGTGSTLRKEWGIPPDQLVVGMIGRFSHWKGQLFLLDVAKEVVHRFPQVCFVFVGGTVPGQNEVLNDFRSKVVDLGLQKFVIHSDYRSDIPTVLDSFDVFVLPSTLPDPFPTVVLEAMAMAKPIVANAHGGSVEMIDNGTTGLLVEPCAVHEMAEAILYLANNKEHAKHMGEQGLTRLYKLFSLDSFVSKWVRIYNDLCK